jgi:hypothetical protein
VEEVVEEEEEEEAAERPPSWVPSAPRDGGAEA